MNAIAKPVDWTTLPDSIRRFASPSQTAITPGNRYVVAGVSVYKAVTFLLVVDDQGEPCFVPSFLFAGEAEALPQGWVCSFGLGGGVELVLGPDFVARDLDAYCSVVDHDREVMDAVARYVAEVARNR